MPARTKRTTTERGLGYEHQRQRDYLLTCHADGTPCWWCARPMYRDPAANYDSNPLEADHSQSRAFGGTKADRLLHATCNRQRGDGSKDHLRPALGGTQGTQADERSPWVTLDW